MSIAITCSETVKLQIRKSRWTLQMLAEKMVEFKVVEKVSIETIVRKAVPNSADSLISLSWRLLMNHEAVPDDNYSLLLLKPDCIARGLQHEVLQEIAEVGLRVYCQHARLLDRELIPKIWYQIPVHKYVIKHLLLELYLGDQPVEYFVCEGKSAIHKTLLAKRRLRSRFASGPVCNVVHTPDSTSEFMNQISVLTQGCERCCSVIQVTKDDQRKSQWEHQGLVLLPPYILYGSSIRKIMETLWNDTSSVLWKWKQVEPIIIPTLEKSLGSLFIHGDDDISLDNAVAAIFDVLEGIDLKRAIELVLLVCHTNDVEVARCSWQEAKYLRQRLISTGIKNVSFRGIAED